MAYFLDFIQTDSVAAFLIALVIFLVAIFLIVKQWINFSMAFLLLLFALASGLIVNHQYLIRCCFDNFRREPLSADQQALATNQMQQAIENLALELQAEKEKIRQVADQTQQAVDQLDYQRQKLQAFIEKTQQEGIKETLLEKEPIHEDSTR